MNDEPWYWVIFCDAGTNHHHGTVVLRARDEVTAFALALGLLPAGFRYVHHHVKEAPTFPDVTYPPDSVGRLLSKDEAIALMVRLQHLLEESAKRNGVDWSPPARN